MTTIRDTERQLYNTWNTKNIRDNLRGREENLDVKRQNNPPDCHNREARELEVGKPLVLDRDMCNPNTTSAYGGNRNNPQASTRQTQCSEHVPWGTERHSGTVRPQS